MARRSWLCRTRGGGQSVQDAPLEASTFMALTRALEIGRPWVRGGRCSRFTPRPADVTHQQVAPGIGSIRADVENHRRLGYALEVTAFALIARRSDDVHRQGILSSVSETPSRSLERCPTPQLAREVKRDHDEPLAGQRPPERPCEAMQLRKWPPQ